jgi:hypothetical protein
MAAFIKILPKRQAQCFGGNVSRRGLLKTATAMSVGLSFLTILKIWRKQSSPLTTEERCRPAPMEYTFSRRVLCYFNPLKPSGNCVPSLTINTSAFFTMCFV